MTAMRMIVGVGLIGMLFWIIYAVIEGQYLEAVAVSSIGSVLAWFALGAGKAPDPGDRE